MHSQGNSSIESKSQLTNVSHAINGMVADKERFRLTSENKLMQKKSDMLDMILRSIESKSAAVSAEIEACKINLTMSSNSCKQAKTLQQIQEEIDRMEDDINKLAWKCDQMKYMKVRDARELRIYKIYVANLQDESDVSGINRSQRSFDDLQFRKTEAADLDSKIQALQTKLEDRRKAHKMAKDLKTAEVEELQAVLLMRAHREKGREVALSKLAGDLDEAEERKLREQSKAVAGTVAANDFIIAGTNDQLLEFEKHLRQVQLTCDVADFEEMVEKFQFLDDRYNDLQTERFELFEQLYQSEDKLAQTIKNLDHIKVFGLRNGSTQSRVAMINEDALETTIEELSSAFRDYISTSEFLATSFQAITAMCARLKIQIHKEMYFYPSVWKPHNQGKLTTEIIRDTIISDSKVGKNLRNSLTQSLEMCQAKIEKIVSLLRISYPQQLSRLFQSAPGISSILMNMTDVSKFSAEMEVSPSIDEKV